MVKEIVPATAIPTYAGEKDRIHIGNRVHLGSPYFNTRSGHIYVGDDTFIGLDVHLLTGTHIRKDGRAQRHGVPDSGRDIYIGKGCWIANKVIIIGPVKIGDYCVIGAGSIVTNDIPNGKFVCGESAKIRGDI